MGDDTMMEVWFKLNDNDVDAVDLPEDTNVRKFRDKVKKKWGNAIDCAPAQLKVFAHGRNDPLKANAPVPPSTFEEPLIVVAQGMPPPRPQQDGESSQCVVVLVYSCSSSSC
jgi:hypothetical protein